MTLIDTLAEPSKPTMVTLRGKPYILAPTAVVPDEHGEEFIRHMVGQGITRFERGTAIVPPPTVKVTFPCEVCKRMFSTKAALGSHKRKHKESP